MFYEKRPDVWVEPRGNWGKGSVMLLEIPTRDETMDNIVAFWNPAQKPKAGEEHLFAYKLYWGHENPFFHAGRKSPPRAPGIGGVVGQKRKYFSLAFRHRFRGRQSHTRSASSRTSRPSCTTSRGRVETVSARPIVGRRRLARHVRSRADGRQSRSHQPASLLDARRSGPHRDLAVPSTSRFPAEQRKFWVSPERGPGIPFGPPGRCFRVASQLCQKTQTVRPSGYTGKGGRAGGRTHLGGGARPPRRDAHDDETAAAGERECSPAVPTDLCIGEKSGVLPVGPRIDPRHYFQRSSRRDLQFAEEGRSSLASPPKDLGPEAGRGSDLAPPTCSPRTVRQRRSGGYGWRSGRLRSSVCRRRKRSAHRRRCFGAACATVRRRSLQASGQSSSCRRISTALRMSPTPYYDLPLTRVPPDIRFSGATCGLLRMPSAPWRVIRSQEWAGHALAVRQARIALIGPRGSF